MVGLAFRTSYSSEKALRFATGITLLLKTNASPLMKIINTSNGLINLRKEIPDDLMATNSKFSPMLPNVIIEASKILRGNANGTSVVDMKISNWRIVQAFTPLPISSSMYNQKNCMTNTKSATKKVTINGPVKLRTMRKSSFFINTRRRLDYKPT
jgi:hypothetical protein